MNTMSKKPLNPIFLDSPLDEYSREYESPRSFFKRVKDDVKGGTFPFILKLPIAGKYFNRYITNLASTSGTNRPNQFSCKSDYTSYDSLTDYTYYTRHLPPASDEWVESLPPLEKVLTLFQRPRGPGGVGDVQTMCIRSTMLFPTFAQHLIDSFIKTDVKTDNSSTVEFDWRKTGSPHDIGLLTLYGSTIPQTKQLRLLDSTKGKLGKLKSQMINGEEWAPYLYDSNGAVKKEFDELEEPQGLKRTLASLPEDIAKKRQSKIFAFGGARVNLTPNITAWNTLLLREHNRIAGEVEKSEPTWDDERVFQTSRNILLAMYLKLVIEEYINHITGYEIDFTVEPGKWMWNAPWYKRNWISAEFAVLYRWHGVIPNCMKWGDEVLSTSEYLFDNNVLFDQMNGDLRSVFTNISNHRATGMNLFNTEDWLIGRDAAALKQCRACKLQSYVAYAKYISGETIKDFSDISEDKVVQQKLKEVYGTVDKVEFWTGLMASDNPMEGIMSGELTSFVANDAFNQALAQPLLSENVWSNGEATFGKYGWALVQKKQLIKDILERNTKNGDKLTEFVGMTSPYAKRRKGINVIPILVAILVAVVAHFVKK